MIAVDEGLLRATPLPFPEAGGKEKRGDVLAVGGSLSVPGAILLAGEASLRAGAGRLTVATCRSIGPPLGLMLPEALVIGLEESPAGGIRPGPNAQLARAAARADAVLIGPGMMEQPGTGELAASLVEGLHGTPMVLDAGALQCLPQMVETLGRHEGRLVVTPHAGEMARLLGMGRAEVEADPLEAGRRAAARLHCTVVMKGARTFIVSVAGEVWSYEGGTVGLATSGSGDVLAGLITGLLARGAPPTEAAFWGVYLHGEAGSRLTGRTGTVGLLARELAAEVPAIMQGLAPPRRWG